MVETRDQETGEIVKQLVDKVRRHKVTRLKKAILAARANKKTANKTTEKIKTRKDNEEDSGFETINSDEEEEKVDSDLKTTEEINSTWFDKKNYLFESVD